MSDEDFRDHYARGIELERLATGPTSRLEFARTKELLEQYLPSPPASVLDVGGGPGVYATWLSGLGYTVHLIDPVPLHVDQATEAASRSSTPFTAALGDAREIDRQDSTFDAALLLGPLYHLTERAERIRALREAARVVRPGGIVAAAAISRFASLLSGMREGYLGDPTFDAIVQRDLHDGQHRNPTEREEWFTTAYFHHPNELAEEFTDVGLRLEALFGVEGPGALIGPLDDPERWDDLLRVARAVEREPSVLGVSDHLLAIGTRG